jgi:hypothetical protein
VLQGRYLKDRTICLGTVRELEARICSLGRTRDSLQKSIRYLSLLFYISAVYSALPIKTEFVLVGVTPQWERTR